MKTCRCGQHYDAKSWRGLRLVGVQEDGDGGNLELRNCASCGSTIAIELPRRRSSRPAPAPEAP